MSGLQTPPTTQPVQDADEAPTSTTGLIHHDKYYNTGALDPIFIQVSHRYPHLLKSY